MVQELGDKLAGDTHLPTSPPTIPASILSAGAQLPGTQLSSRFQPHTNPANHQLRGSPPASVPGGGSATPGQARSGGSYVRQEGLVLGDLMSSSGRGEHPVKSPHPVLATQQMHMLHSKQALPTSAFQSHEHHHPYVDKPFDRRGDANGHVYQAERSPNHPATILFSTRSNGSTARPPPQQELSRQESARDDGHLVEDANMSIDGPTIEDTKQDPSSYTFPSTHPYPVTPLPDSPAVPVHDALHLRRYWEERATAFRRV